MKSTTEIDSAKIEDVVLALLYLTTFEDHGTFRAWKGHDWDVLKMLHGKGWISNPATSAKSVVFSDEGHKRSKELFLRHFGKGEPSR